MNLDELPEFWGVGVPVGPRNEEKGYVAQNLRGRYLEKKTTLK